MIRDCHLCRVYLASLGLVSGTRGSAPAVIEIETENGRRRATPHQHIISTTRAAMTNPLPPLLPAVVAALVARHTCPAHAFSTASLSSRASGFAATHTKCSISTRTPTRRSNARSLRIAFADEYEGKVIAAFDPLGLGDEGWDLTGDYTQTKESRGVAPVTPIGMALATLAIGPGASYAESTPLSTGEFNPDSFKPVCSASDGFYRFLQGSTRAVVGDDNFSEYGPLIAGGLLRIRLELCVVESFFNEAVGPFIQKNGLVSGLLLYCAN